MAASGSELPFAAGFSNVRFERLLGINCIEGRGRQVVVIDKRKDTAT